MVVDVLLGDDVLARIEVRGTELTEAGEPVSLADVLELAAIELELAGESRPFTFTLRKGRRSLTFDWDPAKVELVTRAVRLLARM